MSQSHYDYETYLSPFTWRYGSDAMRRVWSVAYQRRLWRRIWVALAEVQHEAGLVSAEQVADLRAHESDLDVARALAIEAEIHHDLMAEVRTYAEQCPVGGGIIHLGATSMDVEDNADALRLRDALDLVLARLGSLLDALAALIEREAEHVCMAFTHLQPAEPTTVGYRFAGYAQDLLADYVDLLRLRGEIKGKGFKGAVGTAASYAELLYGTGMTPHAMEARIMARLDLPAYGVAMQTYPRRQDWSLVRSVRRRCRSSATRSIRRTSTASRAIWRRCRACCGITRRITCWSARWTTPATGVRCCPRRFWRRMNC
jgi:adenylosuccinate lyase